MTLGNFQQTLPQNSPLQGEVRHQLEGLSDVEGVMYPRWVLEPEKPMESMTSITGSHVEILPLWVPGETVDMKKITSWV